MKSSKVLAFLHFTFSLFAFAAQAEVDARQQEALEAFEQICKVPRYSSYETKIGDWLMAWAETHGFAATHDAVGNVIFDVPATAGMENRERVVLQTHQDMIRAVKDGVRHGHFRHRHPCRTRMRHVQGQESHARHHLHRADGPERAFGRGAVRLRLLPEGAESS